MCPLYKTYVIWIFPQVLRLFPTSKFNWCSAAHIARRVILRKIEINQKTLLRNLRDLRFSRRWWWRVEFSGMLMPYQLVRSWFRFRRRYAQPKRRLSIYHSTQSDIPVFVTILNEGSIIFLLHLFCCLLPKEKYCFIYWRSVFYRKLHYCHVCLTVLRL